MSTVMESSAMIAGEWLEDGTRAHHEEEASAILIIGKPDESGYNSLIKKMVTNISMDYDGLYPADTFYWDSDFVSYQSETEMPMGCCCNQFEVD